MKKSTWKNCDGFKLEIVGLREEEARVFVEVFGLLEIKPKKLAKRYARYGHGVDDKFPGIVIFRLDKEVQDLRGRTNSCGRKMSSCAWQIPFTSTRLIK